MDSPSSSSYASDREEDAALDEDLEALRRACLPSSPSPSRPASPVFNNDSDSESDFGDEDEDDADLLLRRLREQIQDSPPRSPLPPPPPPPFLESVSPSLRGPEAGGGFGDGNEGDDDDDYETLRSIQRSLARFEAETLKMEAPSSSGDAAQEHTQEDHVEHESRCDGVAVNHSKKFPISAQKLFEALKKNRSCQKFVRRKLLEIEAKIEENKELRNRVRCLMNFQLACKKKAGRALAQKQDPRVRLISFKKFNESHEGESEHDTRKSALYFGPKENWWALAYKEVREQFPVSLRKQPWSDDDKNNLLIGIKQQCQEMFFLSSVNVQSDTEGVRDMSLLPAFLNADFGITAEKMRCCLPFVKWDRLASMFLPARSGAECESRWLNCEDPLINHKRWTRLEEKRLLLILQNKGVYNWINISVELGTNRTPFQCLVRYQRSLNPLILNREWTKEEDMQLLEMVETFGDKNWQLVAAQLEGRTANQCANRWRQTLNPKRTAVGRWSLEEDKRLKAAIMIFGNKCWNKISHFVPGRTQPQCRERWVNCLDPAVNHKPWSKEEDSVLLEAVKMHGYCWSRITNFVPSRTDNQCWRRWKFLCPQESVQHEVTRKLKRTMLISNFVDRQSERPEICPDDFAILPDMINFEETNKRQKPRKFCLKKSKDGNNAKNAVEQNSKGNLQTGCLDEQCHDKSSAVEDSALTAGSERKRKSQNSLENGDDKDGTVKRRQTAKYLKSEKKKDAAWVHAEKLEGIRTHWKCKYCKNIFKGGGVSRLKMHIAGYVGDVVSCPAVPQEIRETMKAEFEKQGKIPEPRKRKQSQKKKVVTMDGLGPIQIGLATGDALTPENGMPVLQEKQGERSMTKGKNQTITNKAKEKEQKAMGRDQKKQGVQPKPVVEKQKETIKQ